MAPPNIYALLSPLILALVLVEFLYCLWRRNGYYSFDDSLANFATAIGHQCSNVFVAWLMFLGFDWTARRFGWIEVTPAAWTWLALYLAVDFLFYWFHRAGHTFNLLWAAHAPHHSSEELNYTVAIRASVTQRAASFFFFLPLALLGFPASMIVPTVAVHLLMQFLPHTRVVRRLGWLEAFLNCPAHHRVHHAINPQYLNKNFAGTFIVWDRLFGTFEPEVDEPVYGLRPALRSWNPLRANIQVFATLWRDMRATSAWLDKARLWFMPLDWRAPSRPAEASEPEAPAPGAQQKYRTPVPLGLRLYLLAQLVLALLMMLTVTRSDSALSVAEKTTMGALVWLVVTSWGALMEARAWATRLEVFKLAICVITALAVYTQGTWTSPLGLAIVLAGGVLALAFVALRASARGTPVPA